MAFLQLSFYVVIMFLIMALVGWRIEWKVKSKNKGPEWVIFKDKGGSGSGCCFKNSVSIMGDVVVVKTFKCNNWHDAMPIYNDYFGFGKYNKFFANVYYDENGNELKK